MLDNQDFQTDKSFVETEKLEGVSPAWQLRPWAWEPVMPGTRQR